MLLDQAACSQVTTWPCCLPIIQTEHLLRWLSHNTLRLLSCNMPHSDSEIEMFAGYSIKGCPIPLSTDFMTDVIQTWKLNKRRKHQAFSLLKGNNGLQLHSNFDPNPETVTCCQLNMIFRRYSHINTPLAFHSGRFGFAVGAYISFSLHIVACLSNEVFDHDKSFTVKWCRKTVRWTIDWLLPKALLEQSQQS